MFHLFCFEKLTPRIKNLRATDASAVGVESELSAWADVVYVYLRNQRAGDGEKGRSEDHEGLKGEHGCSGDVGMYESVDGKWVRS